MMDGKEDFDGMFDDFYYNADKQGRGELRRRSSILKQTRNLNLDLCEFEETEARKIQNPKRVSFADTFQVKEYPTGNIYDIPGRHELEASKNSSSQVSLCSEVEIDNIGTASRESFSVSALGFIDHQELAVSKENCVGGFSFSFLQAEKENLGMMEKCSVSQILNVKTFSEPNRNCTEMSKNSECDQNVQKNVFTKIATPSTVSSFVCDSAQFLNKRKVTADDMDITCLPSQKAESYPDESNNKTRFTVNDMELTSISGNDFFDESLSSPPSNNAFSSKSTFTSDDKNENNQIIPGSLNMIAAVSKKELGLSSISPALSFENIKLKSLSSSNFKNTSPCPDFLANAYSCFLDEGSKKHSKGISDDLIEEENVKLSSAVKNTKTSFNKISTSKYTGIDVSMIGSNVPENEKIDEDPHYSQNSAHGVKFMKMFSGKENNRIQVFSSERSNLPISSTAFHEDKENVGFNRKRRSTETSSSELTDVLSNKGTKQRLADVKHLGLNSENDPETSRDSLNHATPHCESYLFKKSNKLLSTHRTNVFQANASDISSGSRKNSVNPENGCYNLSEELNFRDRKYEHSLFDQKSSAKSPQIPEFECDGMELTSIAGNDDFLLIDGDSFEEKQQKESGRSLHMDNSFGLTEIGRTCHYTSEKMELTGASKSNVELKEISSNASLNDEYEYHAATMPESNNRQFLKNTLPKDSRIHHLSCVGKENMPLNTKHKDSQYQKDADLQVSASLNNYQNDEKEVMNQTLISHELELTYTFKTSVASPILNLNAAYPTQPSESCSPDFKNLLFNSDNNAKIKKGPSDLAKPFFFNEMDNSLLIKQNFLFQSNTMNITCNSESSAGNSFNLENSTNPTEDDKFGGLNTEFTLQKKLSLMENHKTRRFDSEGLELTYVTNNYDFPSINDDSFDVKTQKEYVNDMNLDHNLKSLDNSRTHHFTSDKMELTCAVENSLKMKNTINDVSHLNGHHKIGITSESSRLHDEIGLQTDQANALHSLDNGKKNMILNSVDREKQYKNSHSVEAFPGDCKSPGLVDSNSSLPVNTGDKSMDKTFNSHDMELTLMADKSHKLQISPFNHLSSPSNISEEKIVFDSQNRDSFYKKFQISQPYSSSLSKNIGKGNNSPESIPCDSADNKILQTKQPSVSVSSEDNGTVWDVLLKPLNSKDATLKMPRGLKNLLSQTPGAVYTLRKKRQLITKNFLKECILSPDVKNILKRSGRFNLKQPYSEMKAYSPVSYDHKKSSSFHSFGITRSEENIQPPTVQAFNSSLKALNENSKMTSITSLTPAPTNALVEGGCKAYSKENIQLPTVQAFNSSSKAINENSGPTSNTSLTPASSNALVKDSFKTYSKENIQPPTVHAFNSSSEAINENSGPTSITSLTPAPSNALVKDSFKTYTKENILPPTVQAFNSSLKALNENSKMTSITSLTPAPSNALVKDSFKAYSKENIQPPTVHAFHSSSKARNENSRPTSITSLTPAPSNALVKDSFKAYSKENIQLPTVQAFNSSSKAINENSELMSTTSLISAPTSAFTSFVRSEANLSCQSNKVSILEEKCAQSFSQIEDKQSKNYSVNEKDSLLSDSVLDKMTGEYLLKNESSLVQDFNISEGKNEISLESTKNINLSVKVHDLQKANDPVVLDKITDKDKISDISGFMSKFDVAETKEEFASKMSVDKNEVSGQSEDMNCLKMAISKNVKNLSEIKTPNYCETNSPEKTVLETDSLKQSKDQNIQNISVGHPAKKDNELNSGGNELKSASNEISGTPNINDSVKDIPMHANEGKSLREVNDMPTSDCCSSDSDPLRDLDSLRNKFEEESEGTHWKVESIRKEEAVFKLEWEVWCYKCSILIHVKSINLGETSITLTPCFDDPDDEYETLGYKFFQFLTKDEIVSFPLFSDEMIEKLAEYSSIAKRVETLMRDLLHVSVDGIHTLSDKLDPLELCVEILNDKHMSKLLITFHVNLQTYPFEKIIPEVKHLNYKDITGEVIEAITNIEPGENYLWNMIKLASDL